MSNCFRFLPVFLAALAGHAAGCQNLVPNGSFEEYSECPDYVVQVDRCVGWDRCAWSPDYFNACDTTTVVGSSSYVGVPYNFVGFQNAYHGDAYMGMITYLDSTFFPDPELLREHIGAYLTEPLITGATVYISFYASATYGYGFNDRPEYVCSGLGLRFRHGPMDLFNPQVSNNEAAVYMEDVLLDSTGWVLVRGEYVPDSAYDYLVIGNFFDALHCQPMLVNQNGTQGIAYSYVDNVCVSYDSTTYLYTGMTTNEHETYLQLLPNPCALECRVKVGVHREGTPQITVFTAAGCEVRQVIMDSTESAVILDVRELENGIYVVRLQTEQGVATSQLVVQH